MLEWDYSELASSYDDRADYPSELVDEIFALHNLDSSSRVLDLGAGTGKLTKLLLKHPYQVIASEPNKSMREIGRRNTQDLNCTWVNFAAENVVLDRCSISSVWFGSSFNVINQERAMAEFKKYSTEQAWLTCLWNHRELTDPLQVEVENIIKTSLTKFEYGSRRLDPSTNILSSGMFEKVHSFEKYFLASIPTVAYVNAWRSHATLRRQCESQGVFESIIKQIEELLSVFEVIEVPYTCRLWTAQRFR